VGKAIASALFALTVCGAPAAAESYHLIPGAVPLDKGPDGNTIILDAPNGLIVVDTGRHPAHAQAILDYAKQRGRPIAAVINTHWHLDHTTGNWDIRQAFPHVHVYASDALDGALATYLKQGRAQADKVLADPKTPAAQRDEMLRGRSVVDHPERIRPNHVITQSAEMKIAGRVLDVHLARFAATEGDVWLYDPKTRVAIVGDLVVGLVPFMDTACPDGWSKALDAIAATPFSTLVPGHGEPMDRSDFLTWRKAYKNFVDCGRSDSPKELCISRWERDAGKFIAADHRDYVREAASYYIDTRLRSSPQEQQRYCKPLRPS
jgi:glyoxylase-like metal-dependent hydrolase (beta-lactamase superfamily II)